MPSQVDADLVTPGLYGFLTLFLSAVAVYFLSRSMARRVQRVNQRARLQQMQDQALADAPSPTQSPLGNPVVPEDDENGSTGEAQVLTDDGADLHQSPPQGPSTGQPLAHGTSSPREDFPSLKSTAASDDPAPSAVTGTPTATGQGVRTTAGPVREGESS